MRGERGTCRTAPDAPAKTAQAPNKGKSPFAADGTRINTDLRTLIASAAPAGNNFQRPSTLGPGGERGKVTSRSGVLKPARSRVIIGENARREGGLAEQLQAPAKRLKLQIKAKALSPRMDADQHGFENSHRIRSTSRQ